MDTRVHFSSAREDWGTPQRFYDRLAAELGPFDLDVCATPANAKTARYYTPADNGLALPWHGRCWMNPPYGRAIGAWVAKARHEAEEGRATVVCLVPARTDTAWWHRDVMRAAEIRLVRGRLRFEGAQDDAPFPSAIVIYRPRHEGPPIFGAMPAA